MNRPFLRRDGHPFGQPQPDGLPLVAIRGKDNSAKWFAGGVAIAAILLFSALEARREAGQQTDPASARQNLTSPEAIPDLVIPELPQQIETTPGTQAWARPQDAQQQ